MLEKRAAQEMYAEALLIANGDVVEAEYVLIKQLVAPPSFTTFSECYYCGTLPARQPEDPTVAPSCAWCGFISAKEL